MQLRTERLRLVAITPELGRAEADAARLGRALGASVSEGWPPPEMRAAIGCWTTALTDQPTLMGWVNWYWVLAAPTRDILVGYGGFKGLPDDHGVIEIGYAVLDDHQRRGYATEALGALLRWAWADPRVCRIDAETRADLEPSIALLSKLGFRRLPQTDLAVLRYGLDRPAAS